MTRRLGLVLALAACHGHSDPSPEVGSGSSTGSAVHHEDRHDPAVATPPLALAVTIDGSAATWAQDVFDRTPHVAGENKDGEARDVWSLRNLVHGAIGASARVTVVIGASRETIDDAAWNDATRTPIVHRTRRGGLKFRWTDANGAWGETGVKDVTGLEIRSK